MKLDRYRKMVGVSIDGVVFGLMNLRPLVTNGGSVVGTCSMAGIVAHAVDPLYLMTKHAVTELVRSLKNELLIRDIRINAICPARVDTPIVPGAQRNTELALMPPEAVAEDVIKRFTTAESGETFVNASDDKPAWVINSPGRK
jgi:NAD(P)-dependent dehydrogenase (short-subunit alcohol dehydrogenase family)